MESQHKQPHQTFHCYVCGSTKYSLISSLTHKPAGETDYGVPPDQYYRDICQCQVCHVFFNKHQLIPEDFYQGQYNASITLGNLQERYLKIMSLPIEKSDNKQRVSRIVTFLSEKRKKDIKQIRALDVGSGTCVFLGELKKHGVYTACVDPDPQAARHALDTVKVEEAYTGSLEDVPTGNNYDLITYNKVLEHVKEPVALLQQAKQYLSTDGIVYVELPHGTPGVKAGIEQERQEFFMEHYTIFNEPSFQYLVSQAGFQSLAIETIEEPSGKFTIYGFMN